MNETSIVAIAVALLSLAGTLAGSYFAQRRSAALISYRLEQLEAKVNKHNNLIERTYKLEQTQAVQTEQIKVVRNWIKDMEERDKVG